MVAAVAMAAPAAALVLHDTCKFSIYGQPGIASHCSTHHQRLPKQRQQQPQQQQHASKATTSNGGAPAVTGAAGGVPRMLLSELTWGGCDKFMAFMKAHSFVILEDDSGRVEAAYEGLVRRLEHFFGSALAAKEACRGDVYFNERGIPMWRTGFEKCGDMRQAFRIHAGHVDRQPWPDEELRQAWLSVLRLCQRICDRALSLALGYTVAQPEEAPKRDFSVCYALCYPNDASKYSEELNVTEHIDPSLFVIEPCCGVEGLEVQDAQSQEWVRVEALCRRGRDLVLFGGKALADATDGAIKGTMHRVRRGDQRRHCFIYEQKYDDFFPAPLD